MEALQFFLVGVLLVWLLGSGKLAAFVNALRNDPNAGAASQPTPPPNDPTAPGSVYTSGGTTYVVGPDGIPIVIASQ